MKKLLSLTAFFYLLAGSVHADLLPEAVLAFPAETTVLEYDSLSTLRALPNYQELRKQYSSAGFERARKHLLALGISEDQVMEAVMATGPNGFFGLLAGTFRTPSAAEAVRQGMTAGVLEKQAVFCAADGMCFLFSTREGGRVLFGTSLQLRAICEVMQRRAPSLRNNANLSDLLGRMEAHSPVVGVAPGSKILLWAGYGISRALSSLDLTKISADIESFGYSVTFDGTGQAGLNHVGLNLVCRSEQSASVLRAMLAAASGLERAAASVAGVRALPFNNMVVSSTGRLVAVKVDAPMQ
jgi:hypothetical protein